MCDFCAQIFQYYSVNYVSTNLTNYTLRTGYVINEVHAIYGLRCRFVNDWFQSHFSWLNRHFFTYKPVSTHTKHIHLYVGCFIFFSKAASTCRSHFRGFFALSAPRRCMQSAAVVERHTPPRTMLPYFQTHSILYIMYRLKMPRTL